MFFSSELVTKRLTVTIELNLQFEAVAIIRLDREISPRHRDLSFRRHKNNTRLRYSRASLMYTHGRR